MVHVFALAQTTGLFWQTNRKENELGYDNRRYNYQPFSENTTSEWGLVMVMRSRPD